VRENGENYRFGTLPPDAIEQIDAKRSIVVVVPQVTSTSSFEVKGNGIIAPRGGG
jgi:hypothetical protein